jgi:hypothetical protein
LYVPGGKAAYPSSVLMNAIPAKVAGVSEVIMVVPTPDGVRNPLVLAAAAVAGVDRAFTIGGAQAVGALAYGTETIPAVDKIVGPGNAYVAAAKRRVFGTVGIDMIAGPSEILVLCDGNTNPDWIAMDLFSQAEHDELAQSILLCPSQAFIDQVQASILKFLYSIVPFTRVIGTFDRCSNRRINTLLRRAQLHPLAGLQVPALMWVLTRRCFINKVSQFISVFAKNLMQSLICRKLIICNAKRITNPNIVNADRVTSRKPASKRKRVRKHSSLIGKV